MFTRLSELQQLDETQQVLIIVQYFCELAAGNNKNIDRGQLRWQITNKTSRHLPLCLQGKLNLKSMSCRTS